MRTLWTLGGLELPDLLRRTARESWQDAVFGQGGRMAFYQFLAIFPSLAVFLAIGARIPQVAPHLNNALQELSGQLLPAQAAQLFQGIVGELSRHTLAGLHFAAISAGAVWAVGNATWAMMWGLNRAYEVEERRSWLQLTITNAALTICLLVTGSLTLLLIWSTLAFPPNLHAGSIAIRVIEWIVLLASLSLSFAVLYRFAPNVREHQWRWSTPGAACALLLWIAASFGARIYFEHVNDYSSTYGHLNGVAILLLWLYVTNGAILLGGEMNSEIEKNADQHDRAPVAITITR